MSVERQDVVAERRDQRERRKPRPVRVSLERRVRDHLETNNASQRRGRAVVAARDAQTICKVMELIRAELVVCKALVNQTRAEFAAARAAFVDLRLDDNAEQP